MYEWMPMNVLVTGGTGFLGGYVMAALGKQGHEAFAYDIAPPGAETLAVSPDVAARFRAGQINDIARLCDQYNVPFASNVATAEVLIQGLKRGDLDWRDIVNPKH